jgi:hypothetical protein
MLPCLDFFSVGGVRKGEEKGGREREKKGGRDREDGKFTGPGKKIPKGNGEIIFRGAIGEGKRKQL